MKKIKIHISEEKMNFFNVRVELLSPCVYWFLLKKSPFLQSYDIIRFKTSKVHLEK